jgi:hypothetical protein
LGEEFSAPHLSDSRQRSDNVDAMGPSLSRMPRSHKPLDVAEVSEYLKKIVNLVHIDALFKNAPSVSNGIQQL